MTLQLYLLRQHLISIGFALAGLGFLVLPAITVHAVHKLEGAGLTALFEYVPLVLIELVPYLVPIAFLLGIVATFGRLSADNEWTAIRMAGIGPLTVLIPGAILALIGTVATYFVLATVAPEWKYQQRAYLTESQIEKIQSLGMGRTQFSVGDLFVDAIRTDGAGTFYEVILGIPNEMLGEGAGEADEVTVVIADKVQARVEDGMFKMFFTNWRSLRDDRELIVENPYFITPLEDLVKSRTKRRVDAKYMTTALLSRRLAGNLEPGEEPISDERRIDYRYEIQRRLALALSFGMFLLLGASTGLFLKSGTQLSAMTGAIGLAFIYYMLSLKLGKELGRSGTIAPELAAWATNGLFLLISVVMARKVLWR